MMNIKKIFKYSFITSEVFVRMVYFILALLAIVITAYVFGFHILTGVLKGGDGGYAYHNAYWYSKWYPNIPLWYPVQGGGFSFTLSYAIAPSILIAIVNHLSNLDISQSLRVVTFASFIFSALGIYLYSSLRLKNQTIGLMSALLFLFLPGVWFWITKLGYYAFTISTSLIPWVLIFFDWFLESVLTKQTKFKIAIKLFLASFILGISFVAHTFVGASMAMSIVIYGTLIDLKKFYIGIASAIATIVISVMLFAFWFFPVLDYSKEVSQYGSQNAASDLIIRWAQVQNPKRLLFNQSEEKPSDQFPMPSYPKVVTYLSLLALPVSFFKKRKVFALGIVAYFSLFWSGLASMVDYYWVEKFRFVFSFLNFYVITISNVFLPILACYTIYVVAWLITEIPLIPFHLIKKRSNIILRIFKGFAVSIVSLFIFVLIVIFYEKGINGNDFYGFGAPEDPVGTEKVVYGYKGYYFKNDKVKFNLNGIFDLNNIIKNSYTYNFIKNFNDYKNIEKAKWGLEKNVLSIVDGLEVDQFTRIGLPTSVGAVMQEWSTFTPASTINQFMSRGSLFQSMRGFSESVFFGKDKANHDPILLNNLASYLGYKYVFTNSGEDTDHYREDNWKIVKGEGGGAKVYEYKKSDGIAFLSDRPLILVIGNKKGAYENVLISSIRGLVDYDKAWLVQGDEYVDNYGLTDLEKYSGLVLYGYNYKNKNKTFKLLDAYVKNGGNLFMDTGWQFFSKDWQLDSAPEFMPFDKLSWVSDIKSTEKLDLSWGDKSWGVSVPSNLKKDATSLLSANDKNLIVEYKYGKGKIVWSGLNIFGYMAYKKYDESVMTLGKDIFSKSFNFNNSNQGLPEIKITRDYPDKVIILINGEIKKGTSLLWKEGFTKNWKANLITNKNTQLKTYRAGTGFVLINLPETKNKSVLTLEYGSGFAGTIGKLISATTLLIFVLILIDLIFLKEKFVNKIKFSKIKPKDMINKIWQEEE